MVDGHGPTGGREPGPTQDLRFAAPAAQASQAPPPYGYGPYVPASAPKAPSNPQATASLVLGIVSLVLSLLFLPAVIGVVLGIVGLVRSGRTDPPTGRGAAITGITLSVVGAGLGVLLATTASAALSDLARTIAEESATTAPGSGSGSAERPDGGGPVLDPEDYVQVDAKQWESIVKDPVLAEGRAVVVFAEVVRFDSSTGTDRFLAVAGVDQPGGLFELQSSSVFVGDDTLLDGVETGDVLQVRAEVTGSLELETQLGGVSTVPVLTIAQLEDVGLADLSKDFTVGEGESDSLGILVVPVTVTNSGGRTFTYTAEIVAQSKDGKRSYGTGTVFIEHMKAGQREKVDVDIFADVPADVVYRVQGTARYIE
jgi:hypothetical protein